MRPLLAILPLVLLGDAGPRERREWLEDNAVRVASIDPDRDDFADLEPLKALIGDARVVQLGEPTHGDGAVFLAKARLVEFLHREMGFDVLVWESGLFDVREADRALRGTDMPLLEATWKQGLYAGWSRSAQAQPALRYVREVAGTDSPLEIAGYDCQLTSGDPGRWLDRLDAFFREALGEEPSYSTRIADLRASQDALLGRGDEATFERVLAHLEELADLADSFQKKIAAFNGIDEFTFMRRTIDDAAVSVRMAQDALRLRQGRGGHQSHRDQRMGETLIWLANERYEGRKLIVWSATMHQVADPERIRPEPPLAPDLYAGTTSAGGVAKRALGEDLYTVAFDGYRGSFLDYGRQIRPIERSPRGSLAALCARIDHPFLYIDLRSAPEDHWLREPLLARPLGHAPMTADWSGQVDAVFFIREMIPSALDAKAPEGYRLTVD